MAMGERGDESDYERLRKARISENQARMEMFGLRRAKQELNEMAAAAAPARRPSIHKLYATGPPRRSARLNRQSVQHMALPLTGYVNRVLAVAVEEEKVREEKMQQQKEGEGEQQQQPAVVVEEDMAPALQNNNDEGMGAVYDDAVPGSSVQPSGGSSGRITRIESVGTDT